MSIEANKAAVRRFVDVVLIAGDTGSLDKVVTPEFVGHTWRLPEPGPTGLRVGMERVGKGLSDARMEIHEIVAEGDLVAVRLTSSATQSGAFMGIPATGRRYEIEELHLFRVRDGKVAEHWHQADFFGLFRQVGVAPPGA